MGFLDWIWPFGKKDFFEETDRMMEETKNEIKMCNELKKLWELRVKVANKQKDVSEKNMALAMQMSYRMSDNSSEIDKILRALDIVEERISKVKSLKQRIKEFVDKNKSQPSKKEKDKIIDKNKKELEELKRLKEEEIKKLSKFDEAEIMMQKIQQYMEKLHRMQMKIEIKSADIMAKIKRADKEIEKELDKKMKEADKEAEKYIGEAISELKI